MRHLYVSKLAVAASLLVASHAGAASNTVMGAYLQNPGWPGTSEEASFEAHYVQFESAMGTAPGFLDTYVDQSQPQSSWVGNAGWLAYGLQTSVYARSMVPVVGIPLFSTAAGGGSNPDPQLRAMAAGRYDADLRGIVVQLATSRTLGFRGFKKIYFRLGWEMNLQGAWYAGRNATTEADWVLAFRHAAQTIRIAAAKLGADTEIVWNPGTSTWGVPFVTTAFYPGNDCVDVIAADFYANIYPATNGTSPTTWENWDGATSADGYAWADPNYMDIVNDPVNRAHFWAYPTGDEWSPQGDTTGANTLSFLEIMQFAQAQGKPFAVAETGAGGGAPYNDVSDDDAFPVWLSGQIAAAQANGLQVAFVNLWDNNGTGNFAFSDGSKPNELAAWVTTFGSSVDQETLFPSTYIGIGSDTLVLTGAQASAASFSRIAVTIDGVQVAAPFRLLARTPALTQTVILHGNWGAGTHTLGIQSVGGAGARVAQGSTYVLSVVYDGVPSTTGALALTAGSFQQMTVGQ